MYSFLDTMVSISCTYCLGAVACLTFLASENMPRQLGIVDWVGGSSWQSYRIIATRLVIIIIIISIYLFSQGLYLCQKNMCQ